MKNTRKILVVINDYLPIKGADSYCFANLEILLKDYYDIYIVTAGDQINQIENDNKKIYGISNGAYLDQKIIHKIRESNNNILFKKIKIMFTKIIFKILKIIISPDISIIYRTKLLKKCFELFRIHDFDAILTVSGSYTTQLVGDKIKKEFPRIKWIPVLYDPLPEDNFIYKFGGLVGIKRHISNVILQNSDVILTTKPLLDRYKQRTKVEMMEIGLPLVKKESNLVCKKILTNEDSINLVYVGSINLKIRSPEYLFKLVAESKHKEMINIHIFGPTNCEKTARMYNLEQQYFYHGKILKEDLVSLYNQYMILVNFGNYVDFQIPSKVLEYISTGLPILSIDPNALNHKNHILNNYKNGIVISEKDSFYDNKKIFEAFIIDNKQRTDFEEIRKEYLKHTPEWNVRRLVNIIGESIDDI